MGDLPVYIVIGAIGSLAAALIPVTLVGLLRRAMGARR